MLPHSQLSVPEAVHFNNLSFSFQKVRGASGGALPKRRNSKIFLGNVNSCQQFSLCVCVCGCVWVTAHV